MNLKELKEEMLEFGLNETDFKKAKNLILKIGYTQDLAWGKDEGVLQSDFQIEKRIESYLIQGIIKKGNSRHKLFPIYNLDIQAKQLFNEILSNLRKDVFPSFVKELETIDFKILTLTYNDHLKTIEDFVVDPIFNLFLEKSKYSEQIKARFTEISTNIIQLIKKYKLCFETTKFNSNSRIKTLNFIIPDVIPTLTLFIPPFKDKFEKKLDMINNLFPQLMESIENPANRENIDKYMEYCRELVNQKMKPEKITTSFKDDRQYYFKIINVEKFKHVIHTEIQSFVQKLEAYYLKESKESNETFTKEWNNTIKEMLTDIKQDISEVKQDISEAKQDISEIKDNTSLTNQQLEELEEFLKDKLQNSFEKIKDSFSKLKKKDMSVKQFLSKSSKDLGADLIKIIINNFL